MIGACEDCPSSTLTLKQGVERMVMHYIPEVKRVLNKGDEQLPLEEAARSSRTRSGKRWSTWTTSTRSWTG